MMLTLEICLPLIGAIAIALVLIISDIMKNNEYKGDESNGRWNEED